MPKNNIIYEWRPNPEEKTDTTPDKVEVMESKLAIGKITIKGTYGEDKKEHPYQNKHLIVHLLNKIKSLEHELERHL